MAMGNVRRLGVVLGMMAALMLPRAARAMPHGDLYAGYSRAGSKLFYPNTPALNGWEATGTFRMHKPLLAGELDVAHYGIGANGAVPRTTSVLVGPQLALHLAGFKPYVHALIGGEHSSVNAYSSDDGSGGFVYALGGGLDVPIAPFFAWRVQGDRISAPTRDYAGAVKARFTTGIVFRF